MQRKPVPNMKHRLLGARHFPIDPESKVARRAQLCASHWVQGSPPATVSMPPAAEAIILYYRRGISMAPTAYATAADDVSRSARLWTIV